VRYLPFFLAVLLAACGGDGSAPQMPPPSDATSPSITLIGENPQFIEVGDPYVELGATATDNVDGDLTSAVVIDASAVDTTIVGDYSVTYDVVDAAGNSAVTLSRTVICQDTTPPVITLNGVDPQVVFVGDPYVELGASAADIGDGDLTSEIRINASAVDTLTVGDYRVDYNVSDSSGNVAITVSRTVSVLAPPPSDNARLSNLVVDGVAFDQLFHPEVTDYTASVSLMDSSTTVTATTEGPGASLTVNGVVVPSGFASDRLTLEEGENTILVVVTAEDDITKKDYTVVIHRQTVAEFAQRAYVKASNPGAEDQFGFAVAYSDDTLAIGTPLEDSNATGVNGNQGADSAIDSGAVYLFTRDPAGLWSQEAYIKASNTDPNDRFGASVALDGNTLAIGAPNESSNATGVNGEQTDNSAFWSGAVYVLTRDGVGAWSQQAYIKASNTEAGDPRVQTGENFGGSVALSGDTLAVGAWGEDGGSTGIDGDQDSNDAEDSGAVYVFVRDGGGTWSQQAYIKASNTGVRDRFGHSVALSAHTLVVGAPWESSDAIGVDGDQQNDNADFAGAVYIFDRDLSGTWQQISYVKASNTGFDDEFGWAVGFVGDTVAVGAPGERSSATGINGDQSDNSSARAGAVYVFERDRSAKWTQQAYLKATNTNAQDEFGRSLDLTTESLAVGAPFESSSAVGINGDQTDNSNDEAGAAYLFTRDSESNWSQNAYVKASNTDANDWFGWSVALGTQTLVVGANFEDSSAIGIDGDQSNNDLSTSGSAYLFE
jgi:hypothetical protein